MEQVTKQQENNNSSKKRTSWFKSWKIISLISIIVIAVIIAALFFYQKTHFNSNITINNIEVSGLTADRALETLQASVLINNVYVGEEMVTKGKETQMMFSDNDLPEIKSLLQSQWTFFPSSKPKTYSITPVIQDKYRSEDLIEELEQKLITMNQELHPPTDAQVSIENGEIVISESADGEQYDISSLIEEYGNNEYTSEIYLTPVYLQPVKEDSELVQNQVEKLQNFLDHNIEYEINEQVYSLMASEFILDASLSVNMDVLVDSDTIFNKIVEINDSHSTLGKDFSFKTHSGSVISVKGEGYGWALDAEKEAALIAEAFSAGEKSISASNIYGNGWEDEGYGYETTSNNGIGDTYAEVSIKDQHMWIYRDGELVVDTHVVTGNQSTQQDTLTGVWYILFKRSPYTLTGTSANNSEYATDVEYWAPFTNSGQGFHDADWRTNWSSNAYHTTGSNGCVNVPPDVMKKVYEYLNFYDPVVIY
ncbi:L,D-transpeptidase family protein [Salipaludibacillus sp. HK11]|uniref:L,D-transpeptidase family protein n=1 Tax=Salipaludibacillus sp. HK11 TaxID=3394320 RepID=UPI0039FCB2C1